ncbi:hypothetical protein [Oceanicoccus sp. KOV_DT_Chl]|uniref:hypothetical protein n=1 Tax=Oceanicoccus sp. KOV_DT_Chl TaxID=1904639 RepID=UPI000C7C3E6C|nr:hypothetical protein [Oceanicoccus sp. KOV_DT_Chl]
MNFINSTRQQLNILLMIALMILSPLLSAQNKAVSISANDELNFGMISNENGTCRMNDQGILSGLNGQTCMGTGTSASFQLSGTKYYSIFILVAGGSSNGVSLTPVIVGASSRVLDNKGKSTLNIVGDLVLNNVSEGSLSLSYSVSVNYE